jgi:hypothetical protein
MPRLVSDGWQAIHRMSMRPVPPWTDIAEDGKRAGDVIRRLRALLQEGAMTGRDNHP